MSDSLKFASIKLVAFDFDGVFTNNYVYVNEYGDESVRCNRSDGIGLSKLKSLGVETCIISTEKNNVVSRRAEKLGIKCFNGVEDKLKVINDLVLHHSIKINEIAFVGNDINDMEVMKSVGFPLAVNDAYPEILDCAKFITSKNGGCGAVREICDLIYNAKLKKG